MRVVTDHHVSISLLAMSWLGAARSMPQLRSTLTGGVPVSCAAGPRECFRAHRANRQVVDDDEA